jgi:hypothetical protein
MFSQPQLIIEEVRRVVGDVRRHRQNLFGALRVVNRRPHKK